MGVLPYYTDGKQLARVTCDVMSPQMKSPEAVRWTDAFHRPMYEMSGCTNDGRAP